MKKTRLFIAFALTALLFGCYSCGGGKQEQKEGDEAQVDERIDTSMQRTAADTAEIRTLTMDYLTKLRDKDFEGAMAMLSSYVDSTATITELNEAQRGKLNGIFRTFPVVAFSIDDITLFSETDTEVRYTIEMFQRDPGDNVPNSMHFLLMPRRIDGKWYLCIDDRFDQPE